MMPVRVGPQCVVMGRSAPAGDTGMSADRDDDVVVVARVRLSLADGSAEEWMVPMKLTDDALSYHAAIFPPEGAVVVSVDPLKREGAARQDLVIARADITTL
jgi:hypothetical protein